MRAVGIEPDGFVGLSLGELGCSYVDRCFSAEQVVLAAYYYGRAVLETEFVRGSMAAVRKFSTFSHIAQEYVSILSACLLSVHQDKENLIVFDCAQLVMLQSSVSKESDLGQDPDYPD
jgi:malonyl CoA-acyl carrier protein transacylase